MCLSALPYCLTLSSQRRHKWWMPTKSYRHMRKVQIHGETGWNLIDIGPIYNAFSWQLICLAGWWRKSAGFENISYFQQQEQWVKKKEEINHFIQEEWQTSDQLHPLKQPWQRFISQCLFHFYHIIQLQVFQTNLNWQWLTTSLSHTLPNFKAFMWKQQR